MTSEREDLALPPSWALPRIAEVGSVRLGRQRSPDRQSGEHPTKYLRAANITDSGLELSEVLEMDFNPAEREAYALRAGDVLLAEGSGSASQVGRSAIWRDEMPLCCFQNTVIRFRAHAALPEYALAIFRHYARSGRFADAARGIGVLHLGKGRFSKLPFPLPPLAEQSRIVAVLETRMQELARADHALRSALSRSYEQDEEILAAALTGELVPSDGNADANGLSSDRVAGEPPPSARASRAQSPAHWRWERLDEVGELTLGKALGGKVRRGQKLRPYLRVANVREDELDLSDVKQMGFTDAEFKRYVLVPGDILITEASGSPGQLGRPAMYHGHPPGVGFQNHLIRFRAGPEIEPDFAMVVFRHYMHAGEFRKLARGSTSLANLSRSRLATMPFPVPPLEEQRALAEAATQRLEASGVQRDAILSSIGRVDEMADELLAAAAAGTVVPQNTSDEPADLLLARLGPPPPDRRSEKVAAVTPTPEAGAPAVDGDADTSALLAQAVLDAFHQAGAPMSLPDLCRAIGIDLNDVSDIEAVYMVLRAELGQSVRVAREAPENAELEAIPAAS